MAETLTKMDSLVALCKRRGFIFPGSDIYGGLAGTWDYGPLGVALKRNVEGLWWKRFVLDREDMYPIDAAILMNSRVWEASGHVSGFSDPLIECKKCKSVWRADHIVESQLVEKGVYLCPKCRSPLGTEAEILKQARPFNMMFRTYIGASQDSASISYLRPETAQGMFVNFKNVIDSFHPKLPFGMAQIGKAFRNEIAPRDFVFRIREFEQMEIEYFVRPESWKESFEHFRKEMWHWVESLGLSKDTVHELEVGDSNRAHYSQRTIDFEFDFPFGKKELYGLAYRTDFDLKAHTLKSGVDLSYFDEEKKERFTPHVIEPSFGIDRTILAVLSSAYTEDEMGGEKRIFLKLSPAIAPVQIAVFPLLKNKPELVAKAVEVYIMLKKRFGKVAFDDNGNIGKRYRRQDEIGTPFCITIDFDTLEKDNTVTVRNRDTGAQERVAVPELNSFLKSKIEG